MRHMLQYLRTTLSYTVSQEKLWCNNFSPRARNAVEMLWSSTIMGIRLGLEVMLKNAEFHTIVSKNLRSRLVAHLGKRGNFPDQHLQ